MFQTLSVPLDCMVLDFTNRFMIFYKDILTNTKVHHHINNNGNLCIVYGSGSEIGVLVTTQFTYDINDEGSSFAQLIRDNRMAIHSLTINGHKGSLLESNNINKAFSFDVDIFPNRNNKPLIANSTFVVNNRFSINDSNCFKIED